MKLFTDIISRLFSLDSIDGKFFSLKDSKFGWIGSAGQQGQLKHHFWAKALPTVPKYFEKNGTGDEKYCFGYIGSPPDISKSNFGDFGGVP